MTASLPPPLPVPAAVDEAARRKSVEIAIADSGMEGVPPPSGWELEILNAFICGEIQPEDLMTVYQARVGLAP